jgi:hypothetical protein
VTDQIESNDPAQNPNTDSLPQAHIAPLTSENQKVGAQSQTNSGTEETETTRLERDIRKGEIWMIIINALLFITTFGMLLVYNDQLTEMRKTTATAETATAIASQQIIMAKIAIDSAREQSRLDQRAWLHVDAMVAVPTVDKVFKMEVPFKNVGKTAALDASVICQTEPIDVKPGHEPKPSLVFQKKNGRRRNHSPGRSLCSYG